MKTHDVNFLRLYKAQGGRFVIGSDAHSIKGFTETDFSILDELHLEKSDIFIFS